MDIRVITLRYQEGTQGFPEGALRQAIAGREVLEAREHFFTHGNVPHLALVLMLGDGPGAGEGWKPRDPNAPNPEESVAEERRPLYRDLKKWRNERAKADGKPAYAIARNVQLAEIVNRVPKSLSLAPDRNNVNRLFLLGHIQDFRDLTVVERPDDNRSQIESDRLQAQVLSRMPCFHVHVAFRPRAIALRGSFVHGGKHDTGRRFPDKGLPSTAAASFARTSPSTTRTKA